MGGRRHRGQANKAAALAGSLGIVCAVRNISSWRLGGMAMKGAVIVDVDRAEAVIILRQAVSLAVAECKSGDRSKKANGIEGGHSGRGPQPHFPRQCV